MALFSMRNWALRLRVIHQLGPHLSHAVKWLYVQLLEEHNLHQNDRLSVTHA